MRGWVMLAWLALGAGARAEIIIEQLPNLTGGPYSDTDFVDMLGRRLWQREADNIQLSQDATIRRVTWWGFYGGSGTPATPPPTMETIQIRFMGARPSDGLPDEGEVIFEQMFLNPSRAGTGRVLAGIGGRPLEYLFTADLATSVALQSLVPYWLEIVQLGDVDSGFRWEAANSPIVGHAVNNPFSGDWASSPGSMAWQLSDVPEASSAELAIVCVLFCLNRRRRRSKATILAVLLSMSAFSPARATILVDHPRVPSGGPGADTAFIDDSGNPGWERAADDFLLAQAGTIRRVSWLSFYGGNFSGSPNPPTGPETLRVRFYDARPGDTLPGLVLHEETFLNLPRTATGSHIFVGDSPLEYRFDANLTTPFEAQANTKYWLEVAQIGDINSTFRWEYGMPDGTSYAFTNNGSLDWRRSTDLSNLSFQLSDVPEPAVVGPAMALLVLAGAIGLRRRKGW